MFLNKIALQPEINEKAQKEFRYLQNNQRIKKILKNFFMVETESTVFRIPSEVRMQSA